MTHLFSRCLALLFVVILLGECAKKPPRQLPAYPLQPGNQWTYRELQVINGDSLWRRREVRVLDREKIRTDRGVTYSRGVVMEVLTDGRRVSTQHLAVDGDTVKMLHLRSAHGNLEIHFHPHNPEYVRLDSGATVEFHYEAVRYDTSGQPLGAPEPFDLVITRRDTIGIKAGEYFFHRAELLDYFFPARESTPCNFSSRTRDGLWNIHHS